MMNAVDNCHEVMSQADSDLLNACERYRRIAEECFPIGCSVTWEHCRRAQFGIVVDHLGSMRLVRYEVLVRNTRTGNERWRAVTSLDRIEGGGG